jgi:predicted HTH domain antitoxin
METVDVKLQLPKKLLRAVEVQEGDLQRAVWEKIVLELYREEAISFGKTAELLGISKWELTDLLRQKNVPLPYNEQDLEEDLKDLKDLDLW